MSLISIDPLILQVVVDGEFATGVSMDGVDPTIQFIRFDTVTESGGICYIPALDGDVKSEAITSISPWDTQVSMATAIINDRQNPKTYYVTVPDSGQVVGQPIVVSTVGWPQPPNTTESIPPTQPTPNTELYWDGSTFVWSVFPITNSLSEAKAFVTNLVNGTAYGLLQPSDWYVVRKAETGTEIPEAWGTWRESIRAEASAKRDEIQATGTKNALNAYAQSSEYFNWPLSPV